MGIEKERSVGLGRPDMSEFSIGGAVTYAVKAARGRPEAATKLVLFAVLAVLVARLAESAVALGVPQVFPLLFVVPVLLVTLIGVPIAWLRFMLSEPTRPVRLWPNWSETWVVLAGGLLVHAIGVLVVVPFFLAGIAISLLANAIGAGGTVLGIAVASLSYIAYPVVVSRLLPSIGVGLLRGRLLAVVSWGATRHIRLKLLAAWGIWLGLYLCASGVATAGWGLFPVPTLPVWMREFGFLIFGATLSILLAIAAGIVAYTALYLVQRNPDIGRVAPDGRESEADRG